MTSGSGYILLLEDRHGNSAGEYALAEAGVVIGRSRQCDIVLASDNVSRRHARVFMEHGHALIEDLQSANGVYVDNIRINSATELDDRSVVQIGDFHLFLRGGHGAGSSQKHMAVRLVGRNEGVADQVFQISETTSIGRSRDCGIILIHPSISRLHARIIVRPDGSVLAEDLGSTNGVSVNGKRVKVWQLVEGNLLSIGNLDFTVEIPNAGTIEMAPYRRNQLSRFAQATRTNLPWIIAILCAITMVVILLAFLPDRVEPPTQTVPSSSQPHPSQALSVRDDVERAAISSLLAEAEQLLKDGQLAQASVKAQEVALRVPGNAAATQLSNRIATEQDTDRMLRDAEAAFQEKRYGVATRIALRLPPDSVFRARTITLMQNLLPKIEEAEQKACKTVKNEYCEQSRMLLQKLRKSL